MVEKKMTYFLKSMSEYYPQEYITEITIGAKKRVRLRQVEQLFKQSHKWLLEIEEAKQVSCNPGSTKLIIQTWEPSFGKHTEEYEIGPFNDYNDAYYDVDPVKCRYSITFKVEGSNDIHVRCKFIGTR